MVTHWNAWVPVSRVLDSCVTMSSKQRKGKGTKPPIRKKPAYVVRKRPERKSRGGGMSFGGDLGSTVGGMIAPGIGSVLGRAAGSGLGFLFDKITGHGDYKIMANTVSLPGSPVPSFGENCVRIRHKEYLGDVQGSAGFTNLSLALNPGLSASFPWLASIAANYQEYAWAGLVFSFVSTSADALNSTNTALGKVILATDYNPLNPSLVSTTAMLATEYSNYGKPAESIMHAVECSPKMRPTLWQYVRTAGVPAGADSRLYDLGNFQIASQGMQAAANIGGLWATYDVILCKPILAPLGIQQDAWVTTALDNTGIQIAQIGANTSLRPVGCVLTNASATTVSLAFPTSVASGRYRVSMVSATPPSAACAYVNFATAVTNLLLSALYSPDGNSTHSGYAGSNTTGYYMQRDYTYQSSGTGAPATLTISTPVVTAAVTSAMLLTVQYLGP